MPVAQSEPRLAQKVVAEGLGTTFLLMAVVGSGVMGDRLAVGNVALALLANSIATGAALIALILAFGAVSGAHFNPAVTIGLATQGAISWRLALFYLAAQVTGAVAGVVLAHLMFGLEALAASVHVRDGWPQLLSKSLATFGLMAVIWGCSRRRSDHVPYAVGAYVTAAYWFTSSTSFANPAVTFARMFTNTFSGIRAIDVPGFIVAQALGAGAATVLFRWLVPPIASREHALAKSDDVKSLEV